MAKNKKPNLTRLEKVLDVYGNSCVYCSLELNADNATVDHARCASADGSNWIGNLLPACPDCNSGRGDTPLLEWVEDCYQHGAPIRTEIISEAIIRLKNSMSFQSYWLASRYSSKDDSFIRYQRARCKREAFKTLKSSAEYLFGEAHLALEGVLHNSHQIRLASS